MNLDDRNIVLTSRVRFARNIYNIPFPHMLNEEEANKVVRQVEDAIVREDVSTRAYFKAIDFNSMKNIDRLSLVEKHLVSKEFAQGKGKMGLILNKEEKVSIMINEEDHIRLQVILDGLKIKEAYDYAEKLDDLIEERVDYAYDPGLGYLTSCPTNLGTGMRASVMLHLPALTISKSIGSILNTVSQVGMTIRGIYGEGSSAEGSIYQVSNQVSLGLTEEETINNLMAVTNKIIDHELKAREALFSKQGIELEDDLYRSVGLLRYARMLTTTEGLNLLSNVRMGIEMGIIKDIGIDKIDDLILSVQPGTLQLKLQRELNTKERDIERANLVRSLL